MVITDKINFNILYSPLKAVLIISNIIHTNTDDLAPEKRIARKKSTCVINKNLLNLSLQSLVESLSLLQALF